MSFAILTPRLTGTTLLSEAHNTTHIALWHIVDGATNELSVVKGEVTGLMHMSLSNPL